MSHRILTPKAQDTSDKLPITLPLSPRLLVKNTQHGVLDTLAEGKKCFKACIRPINQDLTKFESCLMACRVKTIQISEFLRTTEFIESVMEKKKKSV